jgi:predicted transcriptional regulator
MARKASIVVDESGVGGFFKRARAHAKALDRGEKIPSEIVIAFENPADFLRMITSERMRLLHLLRDEGERPISALAARLRRNRRAVSRDVNTLKEHGLVKTRYVTNSGHGRNLVVTRAAKRLELKAAL